MKTQEILNQRNEKGILSFSNEAGNWYAISRGNIHMITFSNEDSKFYKNEKSFATRVAKLLNTGC